MRKLQNCELNRLSNEEFKNSDKKPVVLILDNIRSLNNIGSLFRTADAFRVSRLCLCGITGIPPHREIHKTALGATESVEWKYYDNAIDAVTELKNEDYTIVAIEQADIAHSLESFEINPNKAYAFIFGNEVNGVSEQAFLASNYCVEIPQFGTKHSFNVAVSAGIVLWDFYLKSIRNTS